MKRRLSILVALVLFAPSAAVGDALYRMRVDGLACPFCAYGVEQKLEALAGVKATYIDINRGVVEARVSDSTRFTPKQMKRLFSEAGFTFRGMERKPLVPDGWPPREE